MIPSDLVQSWRDEAARARQRYADERLAAVCEAHAAELEIALRDQSDEVLSLKQAADLSGYSVEHLRHLVADGTIPNAGRKHAPRVRRAHVPLRPGREAPAVAVPPGDIPSLSAIRRKAERSRAGR